MMRAAALVGHYDYRLVTLSIVIAILSAYAALDLAGRVSISQGRARLAWLFGGATAMGTGIWAMHYIGMEAFELPVPVLYDWPTVLVSLFAAIGASGIALISVSQPTLGDIRRFAGAFLMGSGIAAMHYIGMEAMRLPAMCTYSPGLVLLSVLLAVVISFVALELAFKFRESQSATTWRKVCAALLMGLAIPTMHYVGMAAAKFYPATYQVDPYAVGVTNIGLTSITLITLLLLGTVLASSFVDRRFAVQDQRLAESRTQLQAVFDNMTEGVLVLDSNGRIILRNESAIRLLSITEESKKYEEVLDQFEAFLPSGDHLSPHQWPTAMALRGEFVQNFEILYRHKATGETGAREISSAPVRDASGGLGLVIMTYRDITRRRQIDEARTRLAAIVESSEDAIISKDPLGIVTSWNGGAEKVFGYTAAEMIGRSVICLLPEDRLQEEDEILERISRGEIVEHTETVRKKKNGQLIQVSLTISPIRDTTGKVIGASKIARNISERKMLESQLLQAQKMEAVGQLAAGVAHEINTPIQYVGDNTSFLKESWKNLFPLLDAGRKLRDEITPGMVCQTTLDNYDGYSKTADVEYLSQDIPRAIDQTLEGVGRVARIVRAMKEFSHPGSLEKRAVDLNSAIETTITISRHEWKFFAEVKTQLDPDLPPVPCLASEINQVLLNLVVNAAHAIADTLPPEGGRMGTITLSTRRDGDFVEVSVADTGTGIPEHVRKRVFDPFFTTKEVGKGTGQGLTLAHTVVVKKHAGKIWFDTELGKGTTFFFRLPIAVESEN
jgi:PAS domain S-box-containing protein